MHLDIYFWFFKLLFLYSIKYFNKEHFLLIGNWLRNYGFGDDRGISKRLQYSRNKEGIWDRFFKTIQIDSDL